MIGHQLRIILIRRCHIDLKTCLFTLLGQRTDDIVRLKTRHFQHRNIHRLQNLLDYRHGFPNIFRCFRSLRLVLLICLMAECTTRRIESHSQMGRVDLTNQILQGHAETKDSRGVLPLAVHTWHTDKSVVRTKNHRVRVYEQ